MVQIVLNTPRTLRQILRRILDLVISFVSSDSQDKKWEWG